MGCLDIVSVWIWIISKTQSFGEENSVAKSSVSYMRIMWVLMNIYMHAHALTCTHTHTWTCGLRERHQSFQGLTLLCESSTLLLSFLLLFLVCGLWPFIAYLLRSQKVSVRQSGRVPDSSIYPLLLEATEEWAGLSTSCEGDFACFILVLPSNWLNSCPCAC